MLPCFARLDYFGDARSQSGNQAHKAAIASLARRAHSTTVSRTMKGILRLMPLLTLLFVDACGVVTPTPVGSIAGQIVIEGEGIGGVAVALSNGAETATTPTGVYRFDQVEGGSYTVTISGYPLDAIFGATSASAEIAVDGQTVVVDFRGEYIRTASLMGRVAVEGHRLAGVTVRLAGMSAGLTSTDDAGQFGFQSLRAGTYEVEISDFGEAEFARTSQSVSVAVGEPKVLSFDGTFIRRSSVSAVVSVEGAGLQGITLRLAGQDTVAIGVTEVAGRHTFANLRSGTYTLEISGFDADEIEFPETNRTVAVGLDETSNTVFDGRWVRTAGIEGRVTVEGMDLAGVTVSLAGQREDLTSVTDRKGRYAFGNLRAASYTVEIDDHPEDVEFENLSITVEVDLGEVGTADFTGRFIRTSAVEGQVIIEGEGLAGVRVTLSGGPADESYTMLTDADGMYRFEELRPGDYTVSISDFDTRDYEFAATSQDVSVDLDETETVSFTGVLLRTSGISGRVSVEGMGLDGIAVTLSGAADASTTTDAGGQYSFAGLAAGDYTVSISVESGASVFDVMSYDVTLADDESLIVNFEGKHVR